MFSVAIVTSTRADYGLLRPVIRKFMNEKTIHLQLLVTGAHLLPELGNTAKEITSDGFPIDAMIPIQQTASSRDTDTMSNAILKFSDYFRTKKPDILIVLGDRYEIFAVCVAAAACNVPIAHISGGETTEGAKDEYYRHCITKMSSLHFPAAEIYRKRIIQMGESPATVITAGALGLENAKTLPVVSMETLQEKYGFDFSVPFILSTYHPETMGDGINGVHPYIEALDELGIPVLFTKSNADEGGMIINKIIEQACSSHDSWVLVSSLGALNYFSALRYCVCMAGNSSSGLTEAPALGKPSVNIGNRQKGRYTCASVINCAGDKDSILNALKKATSAEFIQYASEAPNPFWAGADASDIIHQQIKNHLASGISQSKTFYDLP